MTEDEKTLAKLEYNKQFNRVVETAKDLNADMLIMDEFMSCYNCGFLDKDSAVEFLKNKPEQLEIILTGREPAEELIELADYVSEICKIKHPFDKGINARKGIEF